MVLWEGKTQGLTSVFKSLLSTAIEKLIKANLGYNNHLKAGIFTLRI